MSLPSRLHFISNGETIGDTFVNVGWFLDAKRIEELIRESINCNRELFKECDKIALYNMEFTKKEIYETGRQSEMIKLIERKIS